MADALDEPQKSDALTIFNAAHQASKLVQDLIPDQPWPESPDAEIYVLPRMTRALITHPGRTPHFL